MLTLAGAGGIDNLAQSLTLGDTKVLGNNFVNSLRVAFNRTSINRGSPPFFDPVDLGVKNFYTYREGESVFAVTGGFNISAATSTTGIFWTNSYQAADDVTLVRGRHQLGFGANFAYWKSSQTSHARSGGSWMFNGTTTGRGLSDLMVGAVGSLEHGVPNLLLMDMNYVGLYAQDAWRMSDRVTVNYGVRWEPFLGQQMLYGGATNFNHDDFLANTKSTVFVNAPAGLLYPGDAGFPAGKSGYNRQWLDFSPRAGLAWDVSGDGRLAFRSSYGLTYDFPSGDFMNINASAPPWGNRSLITTTIFDDPYSRRRRQPASDRHQRQHGLPGVRRVRRDGSEHPGAARAVVERDARKAARDQLVGDGQLSGPLLGSPVGGGRRSTPACSWVLVRA